MQRFLKIPLWFFCIAACIGLLLRWHFVSPLPWLVFPYWLHAHSHLMFLGWVFNALYLAYVLKFIPTENHKRYKILFIILQVLLVGMLISFPVQGYGAVSIILSTLHTVVAGIFCWWFIRDSRHNNTKMISLQYARYSLIFFLISAAGPFSLGPLMANGMGQSQWYYFAVYFYLHFQYNGVFVFGVLSLFYTLLEDNSVLMNQIMSAQSARMLFIGTVLSYVLSVLWAKPHFMFNIIGMAGAAFQILAMTLFIRSTPKPWSSFKAILAPQARTLFQLAAIAFLLKTLLQFISAHPDMARLAYEVRPVVIAYIHLVVIGVVTFFLIGWYIQKGAMAVNPLMIKAFVGGFIGSELVMISGVTGFVISGEWSVFLVFIFSTLMVLSAGSFLMSAGHRKN